MQPSVRSPQCLKQGPGPPTPKQRSWAPRLGIMLDGHSSLSILRIEIDQGAHVVLISCVIYMSCVVTGDLLPLT